MSGHSKWSTIKRQKAATDQKKGQTFTKLAAGIIIAVKSGGGVTDPSSNFKLRLAIDRARVMNMPKANIDRAIEKASGKLRENEQFHEVLYEAFGPHGSAILIEVVTDNKNRAQTNVRSTTGKLGGTVAGSGAVSHLFSHEGIITIAYTGTYDDALQLALEAGADDVEEIGEGDFILYTKSSDLHRVQEYLQGQHVQIHESILGYRPHQYIEVNPEQASDIISILEALEELDDVQRVFTNAHL